MDARSPEQILAAAGGTIERELTAPQFLSVQSWLAREIPQPDKLLGDLITTTTRTFLVGRTGLGKTLIGLAIACHVAAGQDFLHWHCHRPAHVLYIDGEMPSELIKARLQAELSRLGVQIPAENLVIFARDIEDEFAGKFPALGKMPPLNTSEGRSWLIGLVEELGGIDLIIFDNVMSLIGGDQKDELSWSGALDLVQELTKRRVGQVWLDHTGHNQDRQYGSSTKAWRFDSIGILTPCEDGRRENHDVEFTLSFDHPGKARRRTPDNWQDYQTVTIRLGADGWTSEAAEKDHRAVGKLSPVAKDFHEAFLSALTIANTPGSTTRDAWYTEAARIGLCEPIGPDDDYRTRDRKQSRFRKYLIQIRDAGLIGVDGNTVNDIR